MKIFKTVMVCLLAVVIMPVVSQAQQPATTLEFENAAKALEVIKKYIQALQAGDVATMTAQLAPGAMVYGLGGGLDSLNVSQHRDYYVNSTNLYKHSVSQELYLPVKVTNNWNEGEWVLAWGVNTIQNKATGKSTRVPYHTASLIVNGKIARLHFWYDMLNILRARGYEIKPPSN